MVRRGMAIKAAGARKESKSTWCCASAKPFMFLGLVIDRKSSRDWSWWLVQYSLSQHPALHRLFVLAPVPY